MRRDCVVLSLRTRRGVRGQRAQSTIEFAMIAPVFFLIFFGVINGGVLLFSRNAIQHAADVGAVQIATLGSSSNADSTALQAMQQAGLNKALLTKVTGVTIQREDPVTGASAETLTPDTAGCPYQGAGTVLGYPCEEQYTEAGGVWTCTGECNWPSANRDVTQTSGLTGDPDFALLQVTYTFSVIGGFSTLNMSASVVFRLEPQSL